jgi:hypothetical protein
VTPAEIAARINRPSQIIADRTLITEYRLAVHRRLLDLGDCRGWAILVQ